MSSTTTETTAEHAVEVVEHAVDAALHTPEVSAPGMPQLDFTTFGNQIFWLTVTLLVLYFVLAKVVLPRIAGVLADRQGTITKDIAAAEDLKIKALAAEEAYNQALADARTEAHVIVAQAKADIQAELDVAIAKADAQIAAKTAESDKAIAVIRESAVENVKIVAKDTAKEIVASMGIKADAKTVTSAVTARMKG